LPEGSKAAWDSLINEAGRVLKDERGMVGKDINHRPNVPNSIVTQVNNGQGKTLGYEVTPHDGTPQGMQDAALKNARAMNNYPKASNNETIHLVMDENGNPSSKINARFGDLTPLP
jgi:hypothetical protein